MSKKLTLDELRERIAESEKNISKNEEKQKKERDELKKLKQRFADEERKARNHNLCTIGGIVYNCFGNDISPDDFSEMLNFLFSLEEVKEFVDSEKERRFLRDNPPITVLEESEAPNDSADMEKSETDDNGISDNYTDTYENKITDEKTSA